MLSILLEHVNKVQQVACFVGWSWQWDWFRIREQLVVLFGMKKVREEKAFILFGEEITSKRSEPRSYCIFIVWLVDYFWSCFVASSTRFTCLLPETKYVDKY